MNATYANRSAVRSRSPRCDKCQSDSAAISTRDFEAFVREYAGRLLAVGRRFLRNEDDAADALQDAMLFAFGSRHHFRGNSTVYTWLYRIVVNTCLMKIRSRPYTSVSLDELLPAFDQHGRHAQPISNWTEQSDVLESEETRAAVRACIDQLPDDFRTIVLLRDIEQFSTNETAELLNLSRVAVKTRLHRARQALRTLLEPVLRV